VVVAAGDAAAPAPCRFSADAPVVRHCAEGRNPVALAVVADASAFARRGPRHSRCCRADLDPSEGVSRSSAPLVLLLDDGWSAASNWEARVKTADELISNAEADRRAVALVPLSDQPATSR
jgi:Mg-chelatase subunit ChlD